MLLFCYFNIGQSFDCYSYVMSIPETDETMDMSIRSVYLTKLCSAISGCHDTPVLNNFEEYVGDVVQCYSSQMFNFDTTMFENYKENVTDYLDAQVERRESSQEYDLLNIRARDEMNAVLDTVRLRDSYLREFRYSSSKTIFGDIELQLEHKCHRFSINAQNQLDTATSFSSLTQTQLNDMRILEDNLYEAITRYTQADANLERAEVVFNSFVEKVQQNVVDSLILIAE